jgi:hypothetical protein
MMLSGNESVARNTSDLKGDDAMASRRSSTALTRSGKTILGTAVNILRAARNEPLSPRDIAEVGMEAGLMRIPRGRTTSYLSQIIQSTLYDNSEYSANPKVERVGRAQYRVCK